MSESLTARAVADLVGGRLIGPGDVVVDAVASLELAGPATLSFLTSRRYAAAFRASAAGVVLVSEDLANLPDGPAARVVVADPQGALNTILARLHPPHPSEPGIHPTARIGSGTTLGEGVRIGAYVALGARVRVGNRVRIEAGVVVEDEVSIGDDSVLGPRVVCHGGTRIGRRVTVKAGAVLGGTGFGYISTRAGHVRIPHIGRCVIEDDVDIGSNTCIDRGSVNDTVVGEGTRIDNLVQLGHNVRVGKRCLLMAGVGVAGSTRIGDDVVLAGQVGVTGHVTVGDRVRAAAQAGISGDIPADSDVSGFPARPNREFLRSQAVLYRLAPLVRDLENLVRERRADG